MSKRLLFILSVVFACALIATAFADSETDQEVKEDVEREIAIELEEIEKVEQKIELELKGLEEELEGLEIQRIKELEELKIVADQLELETDEVKEDRIRELVIVQQQLEDSSSELHEAYEELTAQLETWVSEGEISEDIADQLRDSLEAMKKLHIESALGKHRMMLHEDGPQSFFVHPDENVFKIDPRMMVGGNNHKIQWNDGERNLSITVEDGEVNVEGEGFTAEELTDIANALREEGHYTSEDGSVVITVPGHGQAFMFSPGGPHAFKFNSEDGKEFMFSPDSPNSFMLEGEAPHVFQWNGEEPHPFMYEFEQGEAPTFEYLEEFDFEGFEPGEMQFAPHFMHQYNFDGMHMEGLSEDLELRIEELMEELEVLIEQRVMQMQQEIEQEMQEQSAAEEAAMSA